MTWQCLERMVCGRAEIEFEDLKKACTFYKVLLSPSVINGLVFSGHLEDFNESDRRVQFLWQALQSFTYEER